MSVMVAIVLAALVAALVGLVLGAAILHLPGIYAALATLAFALMFQAVLVPLDWVSGGTVPLKVPRPLIAGIDFASDRSFLLLACVCLAIIGLAVIAIRDGTTGRFLDAVRGSPTAARSIGINPDRQRLVVFVAGAGVAGFGGGLLACYTQAANYDQSFTFFFSLVWVVLVITAGRPARAGRGHRRRHVLRVPRAARQAVRLARQLPGQPPATSPGSPSRSCRSSSPSWAQGVAFILFGFGALTYAKHPEGIIEAQGAVASARFARLFSGKGSSVGHRRDQPRVPTDRTSPVIRPPIDDHPT